MKTLRTHASTLLALVALAGAMMQPLAAWADGPPGAPVEYVPPPATEPVPVATTDAPADTGPSRRVVELACGGIAIVGIGLGATFGVLALDNKSAFDAHPTVAVANAGNQEAVLSDVSFGAAVIAGVTGLVLYLNDPKPLPLAGSLTFSPMVSPRGAGAGALLRF